ncbi:sulfatase [Salinarchaeum laminariae]|uniref:sulfatase n=1 Tax=Salinarchaeum laminariae TaxID=869888 RepID=UPI0020C1334F|nr:sulfatase [Salinarchaeum laminariae]
MNCIVILCDTLRRDHCGPYHHGRPLNEVQSPEQPDWVVPTPNMDRLADRGTTFDNAWCGSTPCMPARRDIYTGRYEFLERGWGPLEDDDQDLPRQVSGPPNQSIAKLQRDGYRVSQLVSDHFHLWERGSGNYHMGYTGVEFIRGHESDNWKTDPVEFSSPDDPMSKSERHFRNTHLTREDESDHFAAQVLGEATDWLQRNHEHDDFFLHVDCFDPHEPWDPPEHLVEQFDERGYDVDEWSSKGAYDEWDDHYTEDELRHIRARYAAQVVLVDRWLGELLDAMDELALWEDTMIVFTTDHGTFNGDRGRMGKLQTHEHDPLAHIPFIVAHPEHGRGERRDQPVQLVDIYPTVLNAVDRPCPDDRHGVDLEPVLQNPDEQTREYAIAGQFGKSVTITDGDWILHQSPVEDNEPLYWYSYRDAMFLPYDLGEFENGRRPVDCSSWETETWLSDKRTDPNEYENLADERPEKLTEMQDALAGVLRAVDAPPEQLERLGLVA